MAISAFKTFSAGEILTASDLNSSFSQIISNGEDLAWPATKAKNFNGQELTLDGDGDTSIHSDTDDQIDFKLAGVDIFRINTVTSAVNGFDLTGSATGTDLKITARGSDTDIDIDIIPKGAGVVLLDGRDLIPQNDKRYGPLFATAAAMVASNPVSLDGIVVTITAGMTLITQGRLTAGGLGGARHFVVAGDSSDGFGRLLLATGDTAVVIDEGGIIPEQYGLVGDGSTAEDSANDVVLAKALSSGLPIYYGEGPYKFDATVAIPTAVAVIGTGKTIFQLDMGPTAGVTMLVGATLQGIETTSVDFSSSAITDTTNYSLSSRRLDISNKCTVRDVKWTNASGGLNAGSSVTEAHIENFSFSDIRERNGQGAGYHLTGSTNVHAYNVNGLNSDRASEIEDGAVSSGISGGKMKNIFPNGYVGQPGGYSTSSFTLNAHAHEGTNGVKNIYYRDMEVENCLLPIDCQRSSGSSTSDMPQNCTWENIRVVSPRTAGTVPNPLFIEGVNCRLTNIIFEGTAIDSAQGPLVKVFGTDSRGCVLEHFEVGQKYNGTAVLVEADHTTLRNFSFEDQTGTPTVEDIIDITGEHVIVDDLNFITPESARTFVRFRNGADHGKAHNCTVVHPATNDVTIAAIQIESDHTTATTNDFTSTIASVAVKVTPLAAFDGGLLCQVFDNNIDYGAAGDVIVLDANTQRCFVTGNITGSNTQVVLDNGTDNTVIHNKRGNVFS